jgi:hypothetical protein
MRTKENSSARDSTRRLRNLLAIQTARSRSEYVASGREVSALRMTTSVRLLGSERMARQTAFFQAAHLESGADFRVC